MFSLTPRLVRNPVIASRVTSISRRSMMTLGDTLKGKEKVEEDRYMRAQEEAWKEKLRILKQQQAHEHDKEIHDQVVRPVMEDIKKMLGETGDKVSDEGLEKLAKWKIDLQ